MTQLPRLGRGRPGSRAIKIFGYPNQANLYPAEFPGQTAPSLGSADEQIYWYGLLLECCRQELGLPRSQCWLLPALPTFLTVRFRVIKSCRFPCNPCGARLDRGLSKSDLQWWSWMSILGSFPTRGTIGSGETSWHGAIPAWGRGNWLACSCSSNPSNAVCLGAGWCFSLTHVF